MRRRLVLLAATVLLTVLSAGCRFDYLFFAMVIEGVYPPGEWNLVKCIRYEISPLEILADEYRLDLDIDPPRGEEQGVPFPRLLQTRLTGYDADGRREFRWVGPRWRVDRQTGRIEEEFRIRDDLIVPQGGELCIEVKTRRGGRLMENYLMGIDFGPIPEEPA